MLHLEVRLIITSHPKSILAITYMHYKTQNSLTYLARQVVSG